jgi:hypothetical protein
MSWEELRLVIVGGLSASSVVLIVAFFVSKRYLGKHIDKTVELKYDKKLESHKAELQQQNNKVMHELQESVSGVKERREADGKLYEVFIDKYSSSSGPIPNLRSWNTKTFDSELFYYPLEKYLYDSKNPENTYFDEKIEEARQLFNKAVASFFDKAFSNLFAYTRNRDLDLLTVIRNEDKGASEKDYKVLRELHHLARKIIEAHEAFVKTAREQLNC